MSEIFAVGLDLEKNVFHARGADVSGRSHHQSLGQREN